VYIEGTRLLFHLVRLSSFRWHEIGLINRLSNFDFEFNLDRLS